MIYAAYGSNLNKEQMAYRCPGAKPVGSTDLDGYRLCFKGSGSGAYLTIEEAKGYSVPLGLWRISKAHERSLDLYEGYPVFYRKEVVNAGSREAVIYIMNGHEYGIPSVRYIETCIAGYMDFGFDLETLVEAYQYTKQQAIQACR